jgi:hypothetical protein
LEHTATVGEKRRAVEDLLHTTYPHEQVAADYAFEMLVVALMKRNPQALDYFNRGGEGGAKALAQT